MTTPANNLTTDQSTRRALHAIVLALFAGLASAFVLQSVPLQSANDRSRWSTVWSLVERGTYQIDDIDAQPGWRTIDKVRHRTSDAEDWHTYSTKPPLTPTLVAGLYSVIRKTTGLKLFKQTRQTTRVILLIINVLPMLLALWLFSRLLLRHSDNAPAGVLVLATACFGTLLTPFLTTFNNHTIAATGVLLTLCFAARILIEGSRSSWHFALCGFFAMWTCCNELPAALFGLLFFAMLFRIDRKRTLTAFVPAALIPLAGFFITTYAATGGWKPFYMYYGTDKYVYTTDGVPSYWTNPQGLDANTESPLTYLMHCVIGHHGILSLTPVFLLSLASLCRPKSWKHPVRPFLLPTVILTIAVLGFYLTRTQNYNYGGTSAGLRWAFWLIPFWLVSMVPLVEHWWNRKPLRVVITVLFAGSVLSTSTAVSNPWQHPWLYTQMKAQGWFDYSVAPPELSHPLQSWVFDVPELEPGASVTVTYQTNRVPADTYSLTATNTNGETQLTVHAPGQGVEQYQAAIKPNEIRRGAKPNNYISGADPTNRQKHAAAVRFLNGLPSATAFAGRNTRYLTTPLRNDAFECTHASATVFQSRPQSRRHRCDVWLSDDVPFGAVQVQTTVVDNKTGGILDCQTWTAISVDHKSGENE